jgi:hypothetical protein
VTHLRLVSDKPSPRPQRSHPNRLTREQRERLLLALQGLRRKYGTWALLAAEMGVCRDTLKGVKGGRSGSMATVVRAAQLACIPVERLLSGELATADRCPYCGHRKVEGDAP